MFFVSLIWMLTYLIAMFHFTGKENELLHLLATLGLSTTLMLEMIRQEIRRK